MEINFTNCDKEPIHIIGKIQPHGFLLIFDWSSLVLEQGSENVKDFLGIGIEDLLGKPVEFFLTSKTTLTEELKKEPDTPFPRFFSFKEKQFVCFIHESSGKIVLECEPWQAQSEKETIESGFLISSLQARLNKIESLEGISELIAESIQTILDIDRVDIFRFDQDWNAEVIAEKVKAGIHSYRGHHFPASDIPKPARALLKVKDIRHIPDVSAKAVEISPYLNPTTGYPTDILRSELRYPSGIHLEYLRNMNTFASLSFSVMVKGNLWGLVSCTNEKAKYFDFHKRQSCDQIVKAYSNILVSSKEKRDYKQFKSFRQAEEELLGQVIQEEDIIEGLEGEEINLLSLNAASGAAILMDSRLVTFGTTPGEDQILEIAEWLHNHTTEAVFHTRELSACLESASGFRNRASGLLALEISRFNKEYLLYFKPEVEVKRIWAGNPEKLIRGKDSRIHPRKSFEKWEETIRGKSLPWSINELEIAHILRKDIIGIRLMNQNKKLEDLNRKYREAAKGLEIRNTQLQDFIRIITHNLRSPLANIQGLHSIYRNNPDLLDADTFIDKVSISSENMLATIDDLNTILKSNAAVLDQKQPVSLSEIIKRELQNLDAAILQTDAEINVQLLIPEIETNKAYMESIIHNLLSNALKYASPERKPEIRVKSWQEKDRFFLSFSDNGLGIDLKRYGSKLFRIYETFHQHQNSRGVGLYLTRMQIESLGGNIRVESEPGKGTTFTIVFSLS